MTGSVTELDEITTVRDLIDQRAATQSEAVFLISPETGGTTTFAELQTQSKALIAYFNRFGLEQGDKIAFVLDNALFAVQLFLSTMYGGFVTVPLNVNAGVKQLAFTLDHCDAKVVFVEEQYAALVRQALACIKRTVRVIPADLESFDAAYRTPIDDAPLATPAEDDVALLMYTSGSVGQPKAAIHSHRTVLAHGRNSMDSHRLTDADRSLLVLPLYHINAECVTLMPTLLSGGSVVVPRRFSVSQFWDWLDEYRCTWSAVVPTIVAQLLDWKDPLAESRKAAFQRIRFLRSSSAPLSPSLQREFLGKFDLLLIQAMGSSEAGNIFSNPQPPRENKIGTPGLAWGFDTRIIDTNGADVLSGESGEVLIRGAAVMQGYYKDPEQTTAVLDADGWLHTGDLAYRDQDGYFFIIGRSKELIIKGGVNIAPRQIDDVLESHPAILEAAVVGVPDHYLGEDLVAFAVLRAGAEGDENAILTFCESRLGHFKTPTRIHFVADLPKGPSGKVQRLRLLDEAVQLATAAPMNSNADSAQSGVPSAATSIEDAIAQTWAEVLELPRIASDSNFFSLGGHSLIAIQALSRMRNQLPVVLSLSDFFENPTIAQQAALVRHRLSERLNGPQVSAQRSSVAEEGAGPQQFAGPAGPQSIPSRGRSLPYPLSSGQQRIWFFEELAPGVPLYNESEAVRLAGTLDAEAMEQALNLIVARHEVLRTTIQMAAGRPIAVVHENWPLQMKRMDLSDLTPTQRETEVERLLIDEPRRPYHLETEPGIRATLIRLAPNEHVFILMMHHLICDSGSLGVLWRELSSGYRALLRGEPPAAGRLAIQYGDYAVWQQQRLEAGFAKDLAFWEDNLRGAPELLGLPPDRPRPNVQSYCGARQRLRLDATLTEAMRDCSRREKTTLFTVFAAAFEAVLYRLSGSDDILLGIPLADRDQQELQSTLGFLLQTHVLRTQLSGDLTFRELFGRVQKALLGLYGHREAPFDQVVARLRPPRSLSYSPLFQVMLNWRDRDQQLPFIGLDGLVVESLLAETRTSKFDLTILLTDLGAEIWIEAEYSTDLFDAATIQRWLNYYATLLAGIAEDPGRRISTLPLLAPDERQRLLVEWNNTQADFPATRCVHHLIEEQVTRTPAQVAVVCGTDHLTYAELDRKADHLAGYLRRRGVKPGVLVGILVERSLEMMVALLGVMKSGAAYVPIDPAYPSERLSFILGEVQVPFLITQERLAQNLQIPSGEVVCLDRDWNNIIAGSSGEALPPYAITAEDLAYVIYTSGSTGRPKGVEIAHRAVVNLLCAMKKNPGITARDTLVAVTTLSFDIAALELFLPLCVGATLDIVGREIASDGALLLERLRASGATIIQATPITFRMLIEAGWNGQPAMKVLCGGEALPRELANQILKRSPALWNMYGPTETTIWSSAIQVKPGDGPVPIGGPIDNTQFHVLDPAGQLAPLGVAGELHIGGIGLARGYFKRPELTRDKFISNPLADQCSARLYKTGDRVRRLSDGSLEFLGRLDNQVKVRGFRIELGEIEAVLRQQPNVDQCVVIAQEDGAGEKRLVAYLVPLDQRAALGAAELREVLRRKLPEYMLPAVFMTIERLPLTPNGKIDYKALPSPELPSASSVTGYVAPGTPIEKSLAEIWGKVIGLKQIGVRDDFFALGGHSLLAMRLVNEVQKSLGHKFSVAAFFEHPNIEQMALALQQERVEVEGPQKALRVVLRSGTKSVTIVPDHARYVQLQEAQGRPPFFIVDSFPYFIDVVKLLGADQPVVSLLGQEITQVSFRYDVVEEAAAHVQTILECAPQGPYMVGGCSASGIIAYEIAQQLQDRGHPVGLLTLFDSANPYFMREYSALRRSLAYNKAALKQMRWSEVPGWTAAKVAGFISGKSKALQNAQAGSTRSHQTPEQVEKASQFGLTSERIAAVRKYRPKPYTGRVVLFKRHRELGGRYLDPRLGWGDTVRHEMEVYQLGTTDHLGIFESELDRGIVARNLRRAFDEIATTPSANDHPQHLTLSEPDKGRRPPIG